MSSFEEIKNNIKSITKMALKGNADAQNKLGVSYKMGLNGTQSYEEAVKWFKRAAEARHD